MRNKTSFQLKCSKILLDTINQLGINLNSLEFIDGNNESFFLGEFKGIKFWIYEDGACLKIEKRTFLFEELDYKNEDELIQDFVNTFLKILKEAEEK